jgi:hypothetical protein
MSFKITPEANPILGPIAVFGIIWGVVSMIGLPLFQVFVPLSSPTRRIVLLAAVFVAAVAGSAYSFVFARRGAGTLSWVDKGFYYLFWPLVFFSIFGFGVYLSRE